MLVSGRVCHLNVFKNTVQWHVAECPFVRHHNCGNSQRFQRSRTSFWQRSLAAGWEIQSLLIFWCGLICCGLFDMCKYLLISYTYHDCKCVLFKKERFLVIQIITNCILICSPFVLHHRHWCRQLAYLAKFKPGRPGNGRTKPPKREPLASRWQFDGHTFQFRDHIMSQGQNKWSICYISI